MSDIKVTLCDYKGIKIELDSPAPSVTVDEVEAQKKYIADEYAEIISVDGPLQNGHTSVIDFVGSVDGVEFEGGSAQGYELIIGSGMFIPGFEEQMVGMTKGETRIVKVRFPDNYTPELSGKDADFKVTLHDIKMKGSNGIDEGVIKRFTEAQGITAIKTVEELDKFLMNAIYRKKANEVEKEISAKIERFLLDGCVIEIPESIINEQIDLQMKSLEKYASSNGMDLASMISMMGQNEAKFKETIETMVKEGLSTTAIFDEIARVEGIVADDKEIDEFYEMNANANGVSVEVLKQQYPKDAISSQIIGYKVTSLLRGSATISHK